MLVKSSVCVCVFAAHNVCEQVLVTLCLARPGGAVDAHSQETFCFVQVTARSRSASCFTPDAQLPVFVFYFKLLNTWVVDDYSK